MWCVRCLLTALLRCSLTALFHFQHLELLEQYYIATVSVLLTRAVCHLPPCSLTVLLTGYDEELTCLSNAPLLAPCATQQP